MAFIIENEKLKSGLIIFRRGDGAHRNFYCRIKLSKEDRYKTIALRTTDKQTAIDQAFDLDADAPDFLWESLTQVLHTYTKPYTKTKNLKNSV